MKQIILLLVAAIITFSGTSVAAGGEPERVAEQKIVVALKTDDFEIQKTDLSHLAVGDAETIVTDSGKTVDLLRTEDGIEVYVDGELIDPGSHHGEHHAVHKIKIICGDDDEDCGELPEISDVLDIDIKQFHGGDQKIIVMRGEDEEWEVESLGEGAHEVHGTLHIVREFDELDADEMHEEHERKVIVIRKGSEDEI